MPAGSAVTSYESYLPADHPRGEFKTILPRQQDVEYSAAHRGDHFFITIRDDKRPNSEVVVAPMASPTNVKARTCLACTEPARSHPPVFQPGLHLCQVQGVHMPGVEVALLIFTCWLFNPAADPATGPGAAMQGASLLGGLADPCLPAIIMAAEPKHALA